MQRYSIVQFAGYGCQGTHDCAKRVDNTTIMFYYSDKHPNIITLCEFNFINMFNGSRNIIFNLHKARSSYDEIHLIYLNIVIFINLNCFNLFNPANIAILDQFKPIWGHCIINTKQCWYVFQMF